jgi:predicted MPP superfamily phosphohydrolase
MLLSHKQFSYVLIGSIAISYLATSGRSHNIKTEEVCVPIKGLPAGFQDFSIAHISDLHCDRLEDVKRLEEAVDIINGGCCEIVAITGDYFSTPKALNKYLYDCARILGQIKCKNGIFSVTGNHDYWVPLNKLRSKLEDKGICFLDNESFILDYGGKRINLIGVSSLWMERDDVPKAFRYVDKAPTILLAHHPDIALKAAPYSPALLLCGHTHGGQIRLPLYGPILRFTRLQKRYYAGLNTFSGFFIYTNRGLGTFYPKSRIFCPPEVSFLKLKRKP